MAELKITKRTERHYGARYRAEVIDGDHVIHGTYREGPRPDRAEAMYALFTGLGGGKNSMRVTAHEAAKAGHIALSFDYSNHSFGNALNADAHDIARVLEAMPDEKAKRAIMLSKAGRTGLRALDMTSANVQSATLVVPAGLIADNHMSWGEGARRLSAAGPEALHFALTQPLNAARTGVGCWINCIGRAAAVLGEMHELRHGNEHDTLHRIKRRPDAPFLRLVLGSGDMLLETNRQQASVEGLPIDETTIYFGGHLDLVKRPEISQDIFRADQAQFGSLVTARAA